MSIENVNHPKHYQRNGVECIDMMRIEFGEDAVYNFCVCNAYKYLFRCEKKNGREDIQKARWYLNYALKHFIGKNYNFRYEEVVHLLKKCLQVEEELFND